MKDYNRPDWTTLITTLVNHISSGNRTEEVDMAMWVEPRLSCLVDKIMKIMRVG